MLNISISSLDDSLYIKRRNYQYECEKFVEAAKTFCELAGIALEKFENYLEGKFSPTENKQVREEILSSKTLLEKYNNEKDKAFHALLTLCYTYKKLVEQKHYLF